MLIIRRLYRNMLFISGAAVLIAIAKVVALHQVTPELLVISGLSMCLGMFPIYLPKGVVWGASVICYIFVLDTQGLAAACVPLLCSTFTEFLRHYKLQIHQIKWYRFMVTLGMFFYSLGGAWIVAREVSFLPTFFDILLTISAFEIINLAILMGIQRSLGVKVTLVDSLRMFNLIPLLATSSTLTMVIDFANKTLVIGLVAVLFACFVMLSRQFLQAVNSQEQAERQYQLIAHYTTDLIVVVGTDNTISYASPSHEQVFQCDTSWVIGKSIGSITNDPFKIFQAINRIRQEGTHERLELTLNINGKQLPVETEFSPVLNDHGEVYDIILASRDITERLRQQEYLVHSEKLAVIGQLAAGVAHEIRNPLTAVKGFVQVLKRDFESYSQSSYDIVWSELTRIEEITSELLLLAKPQKAQYKIVDLVPVVRHCVTLLEGQAHKRNVYFDLAFQGSIYSKCNENQIRQVFVNILKNAVESMDNGGVVNISGRLVDDQIVIVIRDQGVGIPEELKTNLGDPFYTTKEKGTGLGLMVVYNILKEHQGNIEIHSEVGVGTEVTIILPSAQQPGDNGVIQMQSATMVL
ncbi:ATP-binding protein [Alicyclobacillus suci]|uniref:ATP-binding protein n=1 Tax=Alicyclobacillus suci TaxID=2816080 RepID=UPI001A8FE4EA|nr:ATP-binding protein [Alicyclobacillus suci]